MGFLRRNDCSGGLGKDSLGRNRAQGLLEYIMVIGIVTLALVAMTPMLRRGVQSIIKTAADQLAAQQNSEQTNSARRGYLVDAYSAARSNINKETKDVTGVITYVSDDTVETTSNSYANLGFANRAQ